MVFNQLAQNIQRLELTPAEANHRLTNKRYLVVYYKTSEDYQKLYPADWEFGVDTATGRITITFPDLLTAYEVKIHCLFDDRDEDYLPVKKKRGATSEFANLARSAYSGEFDHVFRFKSTTRSDSNRPVNPV